MRKTLSRLTLLASVVSVAVLGPVSARATSNCDSHIVVFSAPVGANSNVAWCSAGFDDTGAYDGRIINPGSTGISLRYTTDLGPDYPKINATLNGLGFTNKNVVLSRTIGQLGTTYDSATIGLPSGRTSSGCVTVSIEIPDSGGDIETNSFHTVDAACA
jgi:hypothetical protein